MKNASAKEEKKEAIKQAGMLLTDDELDQVSGGNDRTFALSCSCSANPGCPKYMKPECFVETCPWAQGLVRLP